MNLEQTPAIEFRNVSISFDDVQELQDISFMLPRGGMLCITGDSDSGKSVLLSHKALCRRFNICFTR
ncbi:MAG TPA: hypothetical protein VFV58_25555 [Blastocatellia bacterium]|jgi:ABC-type transporter Mla maintaining outer membrane lipid asymmetry ATPase subunit MlaF|nr:hypothetical protein [Blastocatellia bacterium]